MRISQTSSHITHSETIRASYEDLITEALSRATLYDPKGEWWTGLRLPYNQVQEFLDPKDFTRETSVLLSALNQSNDYWKMSTGSPKFDYVWKPWTAFIHHYKLLNPNFDDLGMIKLVLQYPEEAAGLIDDAFTYNFKYILSGDLKYLELIEHEFDGEIIPGRLSFPWKLPPKTDINNYCFSDLPYSEEIVSDFKGFFKEEVIHYGRSYVPPDPLEAVALIRGSKVYSETLGKVPNWKVKEKEWVFPKIFTFYQLFVQKDAADSRDAVLCHQDTLSSIVWQDKVLSQIFIRWPMDGLNNSAGWEFIAQDLFYKHNLGYAGMLDLKKCGLTVPNWIFQVFWETLYEVYGDDRFKTIEDAWLHRIVFLKGENIGRAPLRGTFLGMANRMTSAIMASLYRFYTSRRNFKGYGVFYNDDQVAMFSSEEDWEGYLALLQAMGFFINDKKTCCGSGSFEMCKAGWGAESHEDWLYDLFSVYKTCWSPGSYLEAKQSLQAQWDRFMSEGSLLSRNELITALTYVYRWHGLFHPSDYFLRTTEGGWRLDRCLNPEKFMAEITSWHYWLGKEPFQVTNFAPEDLPESLREFWIYRRQYPDGRKYRNWYKNLLTKRDFVHPYSVVLDGEDMVTGPYPEVKDLNKLIGNCMQNRIGQFRRTSSPFLAYLGATEDVRMLKCPDAVFEHYFTVLNGWVQDPLKASYDFLSRGVEPFLMGYPIYEKQTFRGHYIHTPFGTFISHRDIFSADELYDLFSPYGLEGYISYCLAPNETSYVKEWETPDLKSQIFQKKVTQLEDAQAEEYITALLTQLGQEVQDLPVLDEPDSFEPQKIEEILEELEALPSEDEGESFEDTDDSYDSLDPVYLTAEETEMFPGLFDPIEEESPEDSDLSEDEPSAEI